MEIKTNLSLFEDIIILLATKVNTKLINVLDPNFQEYPLIVFLLKIKVELLIASAKYIVIFTK